MSVVVALVSETDYFQQHNEDKLIKQWHIQTPCFYLCTLKAFFVITLRAKLSGAVYCYWSCLWVCLLVCVCRFVCLWVCYPITWNCVHRSSPNWCVGEGSDHLQLIKFWPSCAPGKGICSGAKFFGSTLLQPACSVCVSPSAFSFTPTTPTLNYLHTAIQHC